MRHDSSKMLIASMKLTCGKIAGNSVEWNIVFLRVSAYPLIFKRKIDVDHLELRVSSETPRVKFELVPFLVKKGSKARAGKQGKTQERKSKMKNVRSYPT